MNGEHKTFHPNTLILIFFFLFALVVGIGVITIFFQGTNSKNSQQKRVVSIPDEAIYVQEELVVNFANGFAPHQERYSSIKPILEELGMNSVKQMFPGNSELGNYYVLYFTKGTNIKNVHNTLQTSDAILNSEPNYIFSTQEIPNDPLYSQLWAFPKIQLPQAWDVSKGSNSVVVAVLDTGIDYTHPDFIGRAIIKGRDFTTCGLFDERGYCLEPKQPDNDPLDQHGHGTHVAGTIGAVVNNATGIAGVNWNGSLLGVQILNKQGDGGGVDIASAIKNTIDQGADVINLSIGAVGTCSPLMQDVINYGRSKNVVIVAAAGNNKADARDFNPGSCEGVITVGATDENDKRADFSNFGSRVDVSAPGTGILSLKSKTCDPRFCEPNAIVNEQYLKIGGTSMAAPHVSALSALLLGSKTGLTADKIKQCIVESGNTIQTDQPIGKRINALKALTACGIVSINPTITSIPSVVPTNPVVSPSLTPLVSPTSVVTSGTCNVSVVSRDESNANYNKVTLTFGGNGGTVILQMGQKGSSMGSSNAFEQNGFFAQNSFKAFNSQDQSLRTGQIPDIFGGMGPFTSTIVKANGIPTQFKIYEWVKKYKSSPTSNTYIEGTEQAWWYFVDYCEGGVTPCSQRNVTVEIPKSNSAWFFCSVRNYETDTLVCSGNPVCSFNNGPDVGAKAGVACSSWQRSCSSSDFTQFQPSLNTQNSSGESGIEIDFFIP